MSVDRVTADARVAMVAARQHGLITLEQALQYGLTRRQIHRRVCDGRWRRVAQSVYVLAGSPDTWRQRAMAACLAGPPGTLVSHLTAAAVHGLVERAPLLPHTIVPRATSARVRIAKVHYRTLAPADRAIVDRIPCTSTARTFVDLAAILGEKRLAQLVDGAISARKTHRSAVLAALERAATGRGRAGAHKLERVLEPWTLDLAPDTAGEARLLRLLASWGFDDPVCQHKVYGPDGSFIGRIDLAWPPNQVGLEYDGGEWHGPRRWEHDEARHAELCRVGWQIARVDKADLLPGEPRLRRWLESRMPR